MVLFITNSAFPSYNHKSENGNPVETSFRAAGIESYETNASDEILIETHREFKKTTSILVKVFEIGLKRLQKETHRIWKLRLE